MDTSVQLSGTEKAPNLLDETDPFSPSANGSTEDDRTIHYKVQPSVKPAPTSAHARDGNPHLGLEEEADAELRQERDALKVINESLEMTYKNLSTAKEKIERFGTTVQTTHNLMNLYTRLLSQASDTQQLLLDGSWSLARDLEQSQEEQEAERLRLEAEQRAIQEEQERLDLESRQREEAKRLRDAENPSTRGARGISRARGTSLANKGRIPNPAPSSLNPEAASDQPSAIGRGSAPVSGVRGQRGLRPRAITRGRGARPPG